MYWTSTIYQIANRCASALHRNIKRRLQLWVRCSHYAHVKSASGGTISSLLISGYQGNVIELITTKLARFASGHCDKKSATLLTSECMMCVSSIFGIDENWKIIRPKLTMLLNSDRIRKYQALCWALELMFGSWDSNPKNLLRFNLIMLQGRFTSGLLPARIRRELTIWLFKSSIPDAVIL